MDQRKFIQRNYVKLSKAISPNVDSVVATLYNEGVITQNMKDNIVDNNNPKHKKAWALLDLIPTRGSRALDHLYNAVVAKQMYEAADILKPENAPHEGNMVTKPKPETKEYDSPDEGLPDSWPSSKAIEAYKTARLVEAKHTRMKKLFTDMLEPKGQESTYLMSAKPRGRVLIINNEEFTHMDNRDGSFADRKSLVKLFNSLDFDVQVGKNKTKEGMWEILLEESRRNDHNTAQCFVLFILSYGHTGVVFGTDGKMKDGHPVNYLEIKDITDLFCRNKALQGKPKLFFIQACQGEAKNEGHPVGEADGIENRNRQPKAAASTASGSSSATSHDAIPLSDKLDTEQKKLISEAWNALNEVLITTQADSFGEKRPSGADVFVAMSTIPGYLSYRNTTIGTCFIQAICYVFAKYAYKYEIHKLMTLFTGRQKRKTKFGLDPRNTSWSNDSSKFGQRLLKKMGWEKGKGLGAHEDGITEHIKASYKSDSRGLGCTPQDADAWIAHQDDFNDLLKALNSQSEADSQEEKAKQAKHVDGYRR